MKRKPKNYPGGGPSLQLQSLRLRPRYTWSKEETAYVKSWLKHNKQSGRPETLEAYAI